MKRRDFIVKTGMFGSLALAKPECIIQPLVTGKKPKSVLIIGSGFAGLAAARALKRKGIKYTILEARSRIGGRVFSFKPDQAKELVIELGAEWVGNSHEKLISLCEEYDLVLENNQFETHLIESGEYSAAGKWSLSDDMEKFWSEKTTIWEKIPEIERKKLDRQDWWRYLSNKGFSDRDLLFRDLIDSTDFGESIRHTSAYAAFAEYAESSEKNEMDLKIKGGNSQLTEKMADDIGRENILLNHQVVSVQQNLKTGVSIQCNNGQTFKADRLICAIPTYSLNKIKWNPVLPKSYIDALNALQYSRIGKFPMIFKERFWKEENFDLITDSPAHYFYHATKNQDSSNGILIAYAIGEKADVLNAMNPKQREQTILNALEPAFGKLDKKLIGSLKYYWGQDDYSKGAYAQYGKSQWFGLMPELKKPHIHTQFAGEHLDDWQGFMEGALLSGEAAAEQLMA